MIVVDVLEHLVGGLGAFAFASLLVVAARRVLPRRFFGARLSLLLAVVPLVCLVASALRGLPADARAHALAASSSHHHGSLEVGCGLGPLGPLVRIVVTRVGEGAAEVRGLGGFVAASLAELHPLGPTALVVGVLAVALARLVLRGRSLVASRAFVQRALVSAFEVAGPRGAGAVRVFVAPHVHGTPFTGGVLSPYVVFPAPTWHALPPAERDAALAHELVHARQRHVVLAVLVAVVADLLWFVPFVASAERSVRAALESLADAEAVAAGTCPLDLASALVRVGELSRGLRALPEPLLGAAPRGLRDRVEALLSHDRVPAGPRAAAGLALTIAIALVALRSVVVP